MMRFQLRFFTAVCAAACLAAGWLQADIRLPQILSDHMVLQRAVPELHAVEHMLARPPIRGHHWRPSHSEDMEDVWDSPTLPCQAEALLLRCSAGPLR